MFDLNPFKTFNEKKNVEISVKKKQQIEYVPLGNIRKQNGHTLFEINTLTGEIKEAEYKQMSATYDLKTGMSSNKKGELITDKNCIYIPALNKVNALKKYNNSKIQSDYFAKEAPMKFF
jgi:hypothetical protein